MSNVTFAEIEAISRDVSIYGRRSDKQALDRLLGSRFVFAWTRADPQHATFIIDRLASDEMLLAFKEIRESYLIYGDVYIIGGVNDLYLKTDAAAAHRFFEVLLPWELWVCDPAFTWCVEICSSGRISFIRSPFDRIVQALRARGVPVR